MKHLILITLAVVFSVSCAKNRGVETERYEAMRYKRLKSQYTGTGATRDLYFSKVTVVRNSLDGGHVFAGYQSDMNVGYFDFSETKLTFKSVQGGYRGRESSLTSTPIIYVWPITHHESQLQTIDGKTTNKEIDDDRKHWKDRKNFKIDFSQFEVANMPGVDPDDKCWTVASKRQVEDSVQEEPGYNSFVVEVVFNRNCLSTAKPIVNGHPTFTAQYRFSFRKVEASDYQPMAYKGEQDDAMRKFGYFQSVFEEENPKLGMPKNIFYVNRWNPNKTHAFHFTKDFPEKYKYIYRDIFEKTNKVFEEKGLKIRFVLLENSQDLVDGKVVDGKAKEFGDLRYSFINQIEEIDPSAPLGYGPSDANPFTGEIIAANLNVWSGMIKYYLKILEQSSKRNPEWFQAQNGQWLQDKSKSKWNSSDLFLRMKSVLNEEAPETWTQNWSDRKDLRDFFAHMVSRTTYAYPGFNMYTYGHHPFQTSDVIVERPQMFEGTDAVKQANQLKHYGVPFSNDGLAGAVLNKGLSQNLMKDVFQLQKNNGTTFVSANPIAYKPLENLPAMNAINSIFGGSKTTTDRLPDVEMLKEFSKVMDHRNHEMRDMISMNKRGHCVIAAQESLAGVERFIMEGLSLDEIAENIIYRTSIHEFGHNLNLRHNFYGSVDKANFLAPSVKVQVAEYAKNPDGTLMLDKVTQKPIQTGKKIDVLDAQGNQRYWPTVSSSVMDYLRLQDEYFSTQEWEPYDKAALWFAYSDGQIDEKKNYLFCTDEHTITNALCNRFDRGTTPSEVVMSIIEAYEDGYYSRNYRFERAYWNTAGYPSAIVTTMQELKEFLPMWRTAFYESAMRDELSRQGVSNHQAEQVVTEVSRDIKQAIRLSLAFYHSVLQQGAIDKPFRSEYDEFTGAIKRMGIAFDKLAAIVFLAGDDQIFYNPNRVMIETSYLSYSGVPEFSKLMERIVEDIVTVRVDMEPWFISIGRQLYAQSAMNFSNRDNESFINQIKIKKYSAFELEQYFGYKPSPQLVTELVTLQSSKDADFMPNEKVALVRVNSNYYMFSQDVSPYAYVIYNKVKQSEDFEISSVEGKLDIQELYYIYTIMSGGLP